MGLNAHKFKRITYKYGQDSDFFKTLRSRVDGYFDQNHIDKKANMAMVLKTVICIGCYLGALGGIAFANLGSLEVLFLYMTSGLFGACIFFNIAHDASHHAYSRNPIVNKILSYSFELLGVSSYMWNYLHNIAHHQFTSIDSIDLLIDESGTVRLSQDQKHRPMHRYQHIYAPFLYGFYSIFWILWVDIMLFKQKRMGNIENLHHPMKEWVKLLVIKLVYFSYALILPIAFSNQPAWVVFLGFFIMQYITGLIIGTISILNHQIFESVFPKPDGNGVIQNSRKDHELEVTIDFAPQSALASWFFGGFNTHTAHHLFPEICHIHYRAITPIIRDTAKEYGMHYTEKTFLGAISSHFRFLRCMGTPPDAR